MTDEHTTNDGRQEETTEAALGAETSTDLVLYEGSRREARDATASGPGTPPPEETAAPETVATAVRSAVTAAFDAPDADLPFGSAPGDEFLAERWFDFDYLDGRVEIDRTWVTEPYAYVSVLYDENQKEYGYHVSEPVLDGFERHVRRDLTRVLRDSLLYRDIDDERERATLFEREAVSVITDQAATVETGTLYKLLYYLTRDFVRYGRIDPTMRDPAVEDISCDGVEVPVFVYHQKYRDLETNLSFGERELDSITVRLAQRAGKSISVSTPLLDASLPDGSRVQLTLGGEIATRGSNFTVRKFSEVPYTPVDLIRRNTFSVEQMAYLWLAIENGRSLVFAGGTGSGKTTSMNAVSFFIPPNAKVVSIEDTREITLPHDNWVQSVTRSAVVEGGRGEVDMYRLLQASLRQRPEYILVGEIRTEANVALTFFQAIGTGHTAYTTLHADSIDGVLSRLQNEPLSVPAQMIENLDVVAIQRQVREDDQRLRRTQEVVEIVPDGSGDIRTRTVFRRDPATDTHHAVNPSHLLASVRDERGWDQQRLDEEIAVREEVLRYLADNDIAAYEDVVRVIHTFAKDPESVLERVRSGDLGTETLESDLAAAAAAATDGDANADTTRAADVSVTLEVDADPVVGTEANGDTAPGTDTDGSADVDTEVDGTGDRAADADGSATEERR